jgi:TonB family protein
MLAMNRLPTITLSLLLLAHAARATQPPKKADPKPDLNRCSPTIVSKKPAAKPRNVQIKQGDHYSTIVTFVVLESGDVGNARVKRTSGNRDVDASALKAIRGIKYNKRAGCGTILTQAEIDFH